MAAANLLAGPIATGIDPDPLLHEVRDRRIGAVKITQALQKQVQNRIIAPQFGFEFEQSLVPIASFGIFGKAAVGPNLAIVEQARDREFHRDPGTILATEVGFQAGLDRLAAGDPLAALKEHGHVFGRVEVQRGASEEDVERIPGQTAERGIAEEDVPLLVDDIDGITEGVQQGLPEGVGPRPLGQECPQY